MHARKEQCGALGMMTARRDFLAVQSKGKKWVSRGLILQVRENGAGMVRIGFTVSKKVDKRAVARNRIKRRLRAVAADVLSVSACGGVDYVLVGRAETAARPYESLCNDLRWCLRKTGFCKDAR